MSRQPELNKQWSNLIAKASADGALKQRLQADPRSVFKEYGIEARADLRGGELDEAELDRVAGGMKWTRGTENADVIDARGGQTEILGFKISFDKDGKVSDISR